MPLKWKSSLAVVLTALVIACPLYAGNLEDIQNEYKNYKEFTVDFSQDTYQSIVNKNIHFTGRVSYKRDVGVRMDVYSPQRQIIILKNNTVIINIPDEATTTQQEIPKEIASQNILGFFSGLASIESDYDVEDTGDSLILHPKGGSGYISVWFDSSNHLLKRILLKDATGNNSDISLSGYRFNIDIPDEQFALEDKTPAEGKNSH